MKAFRSIFLLLPAALLSITSCQFDIEGDNYIEIDQEINSWIEEYSLSDLPDDLVIAYPINVNYNFDVGNGQFYQVKIMLDETELVFSYLPSGSFQISPYDFTAGKVTTADLVIMVYASTSTNSLADQVRAEAAVFQLTKTLTFDTRPAVDIPFEIVESEGGLTIDFGKYPNGNLRLINVYASSDPTRVYNQANKLATLGRETTQFEDHLYVGGVMYYGVVTEAYYATDQPSTKQSPIVKVELAESPKIVRSETLTNGQLKIYWSKAPYINSFRNYQLSWYNDTRNIVSDDINDTTAIVENITIGVPHGFKLTTNSQAGRGVSNNGTATLGNPCFKFYRLLVDEENLDTKINYVDSLHKLEKVEFPQYSKNLAVHSMAFSEANHLIVPYNNNNIYLLDYTTLALLKTIEINSPRFVENLALVNDRLLAYTNGIFRMIDYQQGQVVFVETGAGSNETRNLFYYPESETMALIKYVYDHEQQRYKYTVSLYQVESDKLVATGVAYDPEEDVTLSYKYGNYMMLVGPNEQKVEILKMPELAQVARYELGWDSTIINIDTATGWILVLNDYDREFLQIIDSFTGVILHTIQIPYSENGFQLVDGVLYFGEGYSIPFDK